jgi:hypothetical protein
MGCTANPLGCDHGSLSTHRDKAVKAPRCGYHVATMWLATSDPA